jgi:hypothetical protein
MALMKSHAWQILVVALAGGLNRQQQEVMEYLQEENRVLREHLKGKRGMVELKARCGIWQCGVGWRYEDCPYPRPMVALCGPVSGELSLGVANADGFLASLRRLVLPRFGVI